MIHQENLAELLYSLLNTIPDPFFVIAEDGTYLEVFGGTERSLYDDGKPMKGQNIYEFMPKEFADFYMEHVRLALETNSLSTFEYQLDTDKVILPESSGPGGMQWFETRMHPLKIPFLGHRAVTAMIINITERREFHRQLEELSWEDPLTGLYNRRYFLERVRLHLQESGSAHIMICDIDDFKYINDHWGHLAGDAVLMEFGKLASCLVENGHTVSRFGGDEFVIALTGYSDDEAFALGEHLRQKVEEYDFSYQHHRLDIRVSIGIAALTSADYAKSELIADADQALYVAKAEGKNQVRFFGRN
ncbi:MAG TPA: diguanylate cyclase [Sphaerochaeta sp.]|jgi:diguanylate cyclase (GGDEF)-like protein|nr:diguanylate cyclase [Spirochaetota bacterium]HOE84400.1 diguanylate cyclase [Sphaerochaeta sp.]HOQ94505.1 diguanylate cyclase [Sphaerochaeta sp.]